MANSKFETDVVLKSSAEEIWQNLKDFVTTFPKALPNTYESIEILQGDGKSVGSVFKPIFKPEMKDVVSNTERIDSVDEENKTMNYSYIEGDILNYYKNFKARVCVSVAAQGCVVKYSAEFQKANQQIPDPITYKNYVVKLFQDLDTYIINNF